MSIKFEVKMTEKAMYDFLLYHSYTHMAGLVGALLGIMSLALAVNHGLQGDVQGAGLFGIMAFVVIFMEPVNLRQTAKRQVKQTKMFQQPLLYEVSDEGLTVRQNGMEERNPWDNFTKVVSTGKSLILYVTRVRAIILPKESMGDDYMAVVETISKHVPAKKVKIRHVSVR